MVMPTAATIEHSNAVHKLFMFSSHCRSGALVFELWPEDDAAIAGSGNWKRPLKADALAAANRVRHMYGKVLRRTVRH